MNHLSLLNGHLRAWTLIFVLSSIARRTMGPKCQYQDVIIGGGDVKSPGHLLNGKPNGPS